MGRNVEKTRNQGVTDPEEEHEPAQIFFLSHKRPREKREQHHALTDAIREGNPFE
jgi:hypothetical protein